MTVNGAPDMKAVISSLVGVSISTLTGRPNRVLRISGDKVWVGTAKSPQGKPVEIGWVQAAADRLFEHGEVEINVPSVGYRSAFVGAVLATLPDVIAEARPRRVRLASR
jgi:hypothetical protein